MSRQEAPFHCLTAGMPHQLLHDLMLRNREGNHVSGHVKLCSRGLRPRSGADNSNIIRYRERGLKPARLHCSSFQLYWAVAARFAAKTTVPRGGTRMFVRLVATTP